MPSSAGIALGVDRLVMVFLNAETIDEVVTFTPEEL
jgi:lysyl-tRNA synthetase class 2